ncbi:MAG: hypothetical protein WAW75_05030 [Gallionella sp.]
MWFLPLFGGATSSGTEVVPGVGNIVITGYAPTIGQTRSAEPGVGSITITGYAPTVAQSAHKSVTPDVGGITITGYAPTVTQEFTLAMSQAQSIRLEAIFRRHGLIDPLVITPTSIGDGTLTMTRAWDGTTETDTVTALPLTGAPTAALVDKLARHYGLYDPVQVTVTSRTDGTFSQTIGEVGTTITVTP